MRTAALIAAVLTAALAYPSAAWAATGEDCRSTADCHVNAFCESGTCVCSTAEECVGIRCTDGDGTGKYDCDRSSRCDVKSGMCLRRPGAPGFDCVADGDCIDPLYCHEGSCAYQPEAPSSGSPCESDDDCGDEALFCAVGGRCEPVDPGDDPCESDDDCEGDQRCAVGGVCQDIEGDGGCSAGGGRPGGAGWLALALLAGLLILRRRR